MKSSLLAVGLLFFATGAQAQHSHSPLMAGGNSGGSGYSGGGGWGSGGTGDRVLWDRVPTAHRAASALAGGRFVTRRGAISP
jgi:hypothetical protein